ncbi:MAG: glycosyltransferase family 4 protein [Halobacteriaceae archaeon]
MRVLNYLELAGPLRRSGIGTAATQQRKALAETDIEVITSPWDNASPTKIGANFLTGSKIQTVDVVHNNMIGPGSLAVLKHAHRHDIPVIQHAHITSEDFKESFRGSTLAAGPLKRYLRWYYSQADLILCPSNYTKEQLESYPVRTPIRQISNGVDLESVSDHERLRDQYRTKYDLTGTVVFAIGNVFERKGLSTFCRVAKQTDFEFVWFGEYETGLLASQSVKKWTQNPPQNVTFTGWIDDKAGAFGAGDIFLFPTKDENQGLVILEAMACGKPVILRDIPVLREFFTHEHDCLFCETETEFIEAIKRVSSDPALRKKLGKNARKTAENHSLDRVRSQLTSQYHHILQDKQSDY